MLAMFSGLAGQAGLAGVNLPEGFRLRRAGKLLFGFNYGPQAIDVASFVGDGVVLLGSTMLEPSGVIIVQKS